LAAQRVNGGFVHEEPLTVSAAAGSYLPAHRLTVWHPR
jgi:hypothetical protein